MEEMRLKHNKIKYKLLEDAIHRLRVNNKTRQITLLDLGVGRANDVNKWNKLGISNIVGIDASSSQLDEARRRSSKYTNVKLIELDLSIENNIDKLTTHTSAYSFDIVCAFFSVHYFVFNLKRVMSAVTLASDCEFVSTYMTLRPCLFLLTPYFENEYIYMKRAESDDAVEIKFKDAPYFSESFTSSEYAIDSCMVKYQLREMFDKTTFETVSFVDYYDNIDNVPNDLLLVELMHAALSCARARSDSFTTTTTSNKIDPCLL